MEETSSRKLEESFEGRLFNDRILGMLKTALGEAAGAYLLDDSVIEVMLNEDGRLWVDVLGEGRKFSGHFISLFQDLDLRWRIVKFVCWEISCEM